MLQTQTQNITNNIVIIGKRSKLLELGDFFQNPSVLMTNNNQMSYTQGRSVIPIMTTSRKHTKEVVIR